MCRYDEAKEKKLMDMETLVDRYEDELGAYIVKLSSRNLSNKESHMVNTLLHSIGNWERISDHSVNICDAAREIHEKKVSFSKQATEELAVFTRAIKDIVNMTVEAFEYDDIRMAKKVEPLEEVIDSLNRKIKARHVQRLRAGECTIELGWILQDLLTDIERVADHCSNIAIYMIEIQADMFDTHTYAVELRENNEKWYKHAVYVYRDKFTLPENTIDQEESVVSIVKKQITE